MMRARALLWNKPRPRGKRHRDERDEFSHIAGLGGGPCSPQQRWASPAHPRGYVPCPATAGALACTRGGAHETKMSRSSRPARRTSNGNSGCSTSRSSSRSHSRSSIATSNRSSGSSSSSSYNGSSSRGSSSGDYYYAVLITATVTLSDHATLIFTPSPRRRRPWRRRQR